MQWKKDPDMHYTEMCMYIDAHMADIAVPDAHPDIEEKVYNYLFLMCKAFAIKKGMFPNFSDYQGYAFYAARRLFFAFRKNYNNQGKTIKGKLIRPIKSSLNYTNALLNPMKIEYKNEAFRQVISEEFTSEKFDSFTFKEQMKQSAAIDQGQNVKFRLYLESTIENSDKLLDKVLQKSPFKYGTIDYKRLKMTILLNCIDSLKTKKTLNCNVQTMTMWKLPKSMASYSKVLLKEFYTLLKNEIMDCYKATEIDDGMLEKIITNDPSQEYDDEN